MTEKEIAELRQSRAMKDRIALVFGATPELVADLRNALDGDPNQFDWTNIHAAMRGEMIDPANGKPIYSDPKMRSDELIRTFAEERERKLPDAFLTRQAEPPA